MNSNLTIAITNKNCSGNPSGRFSEARVLKRSSGPQGADSSTTTATTTTTTNNTNSNTTTYY